MMNSEYRYSLDVLQLIDSVFPVGSFAHSGGLESVVSLTETEFPTSRNNASLKTVENFNKFQELTLSMLENTGTLQVPFVRDAFAARDNQLTVELLDKDLHMMMTNHVARRASLQQGRSLAAAAGVAYSFHPKATQLQELSSAVSSGRIAGHYASVFGVVCGILGVELLQTAQLFLYCQLRTIIGSAVRLGLLGPLKGQEIQNRIQQNLPGLADRCVKILEPNICHPVLEIAQNAHDQLFAKLFHS